MKWVHKSRILVAAVGWTLIALSIPKSFGEFIFAIVGLGFGSFLFDFHHSNLLKRIISNSPVDWSILAQRDLYCGLILGISLQSIGLLALMYELRELYHGYQCGLIGVAIWLGVSAGNKLCFQLVQVMRQKGVFLSPNSMNNP